MWEGCKNRTQCHWVGSFTSKLGRYGTADPRIQWIAVVEGGGATCNNIIYLDSLGTINSTISMGGCNFSGLWNGNCNRYPGGCGISPCTAFNGLCEDEGKALSYDDTVVYLESKRRVSTGGYIVVNNGLTGTVVIIFQNMYHYYHHSMCA